MKKFPIGPVRAERKGAGAPEGSFIFGPETDGYLSCQCGVGQRCHREILLLLAKAKFGAMIEKVYHDYPRALERLTRET